MLLAAWGATDDDAWAALAAELLVSPGDVLDDFRDVAAHLRIARRDGGRAVEGSGIVSIGGCTAAVDGWIEGVGKRGRSAAATLIESYLLRGPRFASGLNGEFAFVLHDAAAHELLVGCDASGVRAPAWFSGEDGFVVCSRALAILRHPAVRTRRWNERYFAHTATGILSPPAEVTAVDGVTRVRPGATLRFELLPGRPPQEVHRDTVASRVPSRPTGVDELLSAIDAATARRVGRTYPALALSGGIDSALIATALHRCAPCVDAFSLVSSSASDAGDALDAVGRELVNVRIRRVDADDACGLGEDHGAIADDPVVAGPALQVARGLLYRTVAAAGFAALFNGEGGDELFDLAWRARPRSRLDLGALLGRLAASPVAARLPPSLLRAATSPILRSDRTRALDAISAFARAARWVRAQFAASDAFHRACEDAFAAFSVEGPAGRIVVVQEAMQRNYIAQSLHHARAGIEQSSPLLDRDVVRLASALARGGPEKPALRAAALRRLPRSFVERRKEEALDALLRDRALRVEAGVREAIADIESCAPLRSAIDVPALAGALRDPMALPSDARERAFRLLFVGRWARRAAAAFGIREPS